MRKAWLVPVAFLWPIVCSAEQWVFYEPVLVTAEGKDQAFHHLESSGRRNVAVSGETVAISLEDDRDGTPRVYIAQKQIADTDFSVELLISGDCEAYEPSIIGLSDEKFMLAWEEN